MKARLLIDTPKDVYTNLSIDETLLKFCKIPTLRIYSWSRQSATVGRFQSLRDELDVAFCEQRQIQFTRRTTGGGACFQDDEIIYSLSIPVENEFFSPDLHDSYHFICEAVIRGLSKIDIQAEYKPINDLVVGTKKISGCAQTRKNNIILHHGTLLMGVNPELMFRVLKVPKEKISDKLISDFKDRVTSIRDILHTDISKEKLTQCIVEGFEDIFGFNLYEDVLTDEELQYADKVKKEVFTNPDWIFER